MFIKSQSRLVKITVFMAYPCFILLLLSASIMFKGTSAMQNPQIVVDVDVRTMLQTMEGFGSSERVFDDPHVFNNFDPATGRSSTKLTTAQQDEVLDRLYIDLRLNRVRPATEEGIELENDNNDPNVIDPIKFNFAWKRLDAHCDYIKRARQRGVTLYFLSPVSRERWQGAATPNDAAEYGEWLFAQVQRCRQSGVEFPYLSVVNEPSYNRNPMSGQFIRDVIKTLGPKLRGAGFTTRFVITDDLNPTEAYATMTPILADPEARSYVGALAFHLYGYNEATLGQMKQVSEQYNLPLWMTEYYLEEGMIDSPFDYADQIMHTLISDYNVNALDYLWGFFGQWDRGGQLITLRHDDSDAQQYQGYRLNKIYYVVGQYSKFIQPGARRVQTRSSENTIKVTAYTNGGDLTIVAINNTNNDRVAQFNLNGISGITALQPTRTSESENWAALPAISVSGSSLAAALPKRSITTFTAVKTNVVNVSAANYIASALGPESIATAFGSNLATATLGGVTVPLPTALAGTQVLVKDSAGTGRLAPLFFVSPFQVNYQIPPGTAPGAATMTLTSGDGTISIGTVQIATIAPGIFTANATGRGLAAALALRVKADGSQTYEPVAQCAAGGECVPRPVDLGPDTDRVFLVLFGTGIRFHGSLMGVSARVRGENAEVLFAGPAPNLVGLDQVNVLLPRSLIGSGMVNVTLVVNGQTANTVQINIR